MWTAIILWAANIAVVAILARDRHGPHLAGQVLVYPVIDGRRATRSYDEHGEGGLLTAADMQWFWNHYAPAGHALDPLASPILQTNLKGLPNAFVVTAEFDPLRDEGCAYANALRADGVAVGHVHCPDLPHGFLTFAPMSVSSDKALTMIAESIASFGGRQA